MTNIHWRKSSYSGTHQCVEVGRTIGGTAIRDSKDRADDHILATTSQWPHFLTAIKTGRYDS